MKLEFGFGTGVQSVEVPEKNLMGVLMSNDVPRGLMNEEEVTRALQSPIGAPRLKDIVKPGEKIVIQGIHKLGDGMRVRVVPASEFH